MAQTTTTSTQFTLNLRDVLKGLLVAVLSPVFTILLTSLNAGSLVFDWKSIGAVALAAMLSYFLKNFLSPAQIVINNSEEAKSVKEGESEVIIKNK